MKISTLKLTVPATLCSLFFCVQRIVSQGKKPNVIQILTDDQGRGDLVSKGRIFLKTSHIDQLAKEGIKFTHCYAAVICSPARSTIRTGRTSCKNGVFRWIPAGHLDNYSENTRIKKELDV